MKIAVIGGTGLIGTEVVDILAAHGHEAVVVSRSNGVDLLTGDGLPEALTGCTVVLDVSNSPTYDEQSTQFFTTSMGNLLSAATEAGVQHLVVLSIVGADEVADNVYYQAKVVQENAAKNASVPYTIVRATQFYGFVEQVLSWAADEKHLYAPTSKVQPIAPRDVAQAIVDAGGNEPLNGTRTVAGPDVFTLDEFARIGVEVKDDERTVITDEDATILAHTGDALIGNSETALAPTTYRDWLGQQ